MYPQNQNQVQYQPPPQYQPSPQQGQLFRVYHHPTMGFEAVKVGFSWWAFLMGPLWMMACGLWGYTAIFFVLWIACAVIMTFIEPTLNLSLWFFSIFIGFNGNQWRESKLFESGYGFVGAFHAFSKEAAIAIAVSQIPRR